MEGIEPGPFSLGSIFTGCVDITSIRQGKEIYSIAISKGMQSNNFVCGALVEIYCKCNDIIVAQTAFEPNVYIWNSILVSLMENK